MSDDYCDGVPIAFDIFIRYQEDNMNKHQIKGRIEQAKGRVKQLTGRIIGNKKLEQRGGIQKAGGKIESGYGDVKEDIKDST